MIMQTQLEHAKKNLITPQARQVCRLEKVDPLILSGLIKQGKTVILSNKSRRAKNPCGIGAGLRTKVNANIGTSTDKCRIQDELEKLSIAVKYGADTVMDLSVGADLDNIRKELIKASPLPFGTVPIYEIAINARKRKKNFLKFGLDDILKTLECQARDGVDFFTIHAGVTTKSIAQLKKRKRLLGIVSRGGAILANWIEHHKRENPFYEHFDRVLDIAYDYDITLSLGDGLRPGSVLDATDSAQISELEILGELALRARKRNVQVIIEGPGHVPINQIARNVEMEKRICRQAPFYILGPLVTDVAAGYDHISSSIGGALAASLGADFLCFVTASEHLRHPLAEDVREAVVASRIAAHAADLAKGIGSSIDWDRKMSAARRKRDWKSQIALSIDPEKARSLRESSKPHLSDVCTMCGEYCSIKMMEDCLRA